MTVSVVVSVDGSSRVSRVMAGFVISVSIRICSILQ
jgi:hypothetical protein